MSIQLTDLNNCDLEPIHIPGKIQSHGFLVVVDKQGLLASASANTREFIGVEPAALLGKSIDQFQTFLAGGLPHDILSALRSQSTHQELTNGFQNPVRVTINDANYNLVISKAGDYTLLEFEPILDRRRGEVQKMINRSIPGILGGDDLPSLLEYAARQVKDIIQYDRVMIYRFASDGHGEVVAEACNEDLEPWLGLHYPASDIPKQARELYKLNLTRLIADVHSTDSAIVSTAATPLIDLTYSQLRAVSPIHIQYLKNMGVASSYSISLIYQKELWGLIACHNYTPRFIDYETRDSSKLVGQILSAALEFRQFNENLQIQTFFQHKVDQLSKQLNNKTTLEDALTKGDVTLLNVAHASGAVLFYDDKQFPLGKTPDQRQLAALLSWVTENHGGSIYHTSSLSVDFPPAEEYKKSGAGILVLPLSRNQNECIIWFKEEMLQQVKWAGDPNKPVTVSKDGMQNLSPRHSFEIWTKDVTGRSAEWTPEEINSVSLLKDEILTSISTKASASRVMNERLRVAYEELDTFSYTISHDLKTPLAAIKGYAQILGTDQGVTGKGKDMLGRIVDRVEKMNFMIKEVLEYSRIGRLTEDLQIIDPAQVVNEIIQDLEQNYVARKYQISVGNMPLLRGDPVMIWQVFSNLIGNAMKYSQMNEAPMIQIEGWTSEKEVFYSVRDNGIGIPRKDLDNIFVLFSRMSNTAGIEGSGVGLAIVKKIVEKHGGIIWAQSELGIGTTIFLSFPISSPIPRIS